MWEHLNRQNGLYPSLSAFAKMRAITVGLQPQFVLAPITDGIHLSRAALEEPGLRTLIQHACSIVGVTNDLFTYEREAAQGEVHNQVILLMNECGMSLEEARYAAVQQHNDELRAFVACERQLPDAGPDVFERQRFVGILRSWIRGHLDWAYETGRYRAR
jgi:5-epi-alpha-selinene synthase